MIEMIPMLVPVLIVWWIWSRRRAKKEEKAREQIIIEAFKFDPPKAHVTENAGFASREEMKAAGCLKAPGVVAGRLGNEIIRFPAKIRPNIAVWGGAGAGKSTLIESTCLDWPHSLIIFDVTGEHACISSKWRRRYGPVFQWNPTEIFKGSISAQPVRLNPIGDYWMRGNQLDSRAETVAAGIVPKVGGQNAFFHDTARSFLAGFILGQAVNGIAEQQNLPFIARDIVCSDPERYVRHILSITKNAAVRSRLERLVTQPGDHLKSMLDCMETLRTDMSFLTNEVIAHGFSAADITIGQFRKAPQTLYINAPLSDIKTFGPANKLILSMICAELMQAEHVGNTPVMVICDELLQYGRDLDVLADTLAAARKYYSLMLCMTSFSDLESILPRDHKTVAANLGMMQFLDVSTDVPGSEFLSKLLGDVEVTTTSKNVTAPLNWTIEPDFGNSPDSHVVNVPDAAGMRKLGVTHSRQTIKRPLMHPFELRQQLGRDEMIVIMRDVAKPMRLLKAPYYEIPEFNRRAGKNPYLRRK
jgi:type IV secretory pathway TraG/TraD family ATPase VirD4